MSTAKRKPVLTMAQQADKHELYEEAVQAVDGEVEYLVDTFKELRGREPISFREDFCGTASAACEWVRTHPKRIAIGVDIDEETLEWGRANRVGQLPEKDRPRVKLLLDDVRTVKTDPVDIVGAFNFSYYCFKTRKELGGYFRSVRNALNDDGMLVLDVFGGSEAFTVQKEKTKYDDFTYIWDQAEFDPVTHRMVCHIHFKFPDGSKLKNAFTYEWRIWTMPEIRELLEEAGYSKVRVYWEDEDEDGEANGEFYETETGEADPAWIAYVVAEK
jgi:SAM-dependent methyltransferase